MMTSQGLDCSFDGYALDHSPLSIWRSILLSPSLNPSARSADASFRSIATRPASSSTGGSTRRTGVRPQSTSSASISRSSCSRLPRSSRTSRPLRRVAPRFRRTDRSGRASSQAEAYRGKTMELQADGARGRAASAVASPVVACGTRIPRLRRVRTRQRPRPFGAQVRQAPVCTTTRSRRLQAALRTFVLVSWACLLARLRSRRSASRRSA